MSAISNYATKPPFEPFEPDKKASIVNRREIGLLHNKARHILTHYDEAMGTKTVVLDRSGQLVNTKVSEVCEFCKQYFYNPSQIWQGKTYPCKKIHLNALAKSRRTGKSHIYSCMIGFAYWTCPLYRNRHYTGAITAGQPLLCKREEAVENFRLHCKDRILAEKFKKLLAGVPEKSNEEIQAMAGILELCAQEMSETGEELTKAIRRIVRRGGECKNIKISVPENQVEKERLLLAAFQRGDIDTGCEIIKELIDGINTGGPQNLEMKRVRAIELIVYLSRANANSGTSFNDAIQKANNKNLKRIQESKTSEELIENVYFAAGQMAGEIFSFRGMRHASALRRAQSFIWKNLTRKVSLEEIAKAVGLSAPYFSTVFKEEMGENFSSYINRLRIEKAATLLTETGTPIKTVAKFCGFEDQSWFSKIFKHFTGITPGKYRETGCP
jgi:AraC-like DNA-binding protein/ligand-binding sensor protein